MKIDFWKLKQYTKWFEFELFPLCGINKVSIAASHQAGGEKDRKKKWKGQEGEENTFDSR